MPILDLSPDDQTITLTGEVTLPEVYAALPAGLFPPFPHVNLPGGVGGLIGRGGFGQTFPFASDVLGVTFRAASGRVVRAGGRTVKNVQGYDLTRPFVGSFGMLGELLEVTLRLRPGLSVGHVAHQGPLAPTTARFTWAAPDGTHVMHFGHEREVRAALDLPGAQSVTQAPEYAPLFPGGMGVGVAGPLRDLRLCWQNGALAPEPPALFRTLAASL
jgi:FAD/FMN-containing dehydrogenase